ncbi:hypothetical protein GCM10010124_14250 [Pilimelia terevasa]|uniref:Peptidase inhibitor family I36 n=1 Tax=Pilimelia terevasa TaxID=53372 RepID=A0A8J3BLC2_9ACTN|nr:peptidase inhibitor family I36 protein [Pilimelia terevasa]GGK22845.1 hypothetical protein GCM10010124_14250 [Pilimelia terevasa]
MSRRKAWGVVTAGALAAVLGTVGVASASSTAESAGPEPGMATFEGKLIDLRKGWGEARVCDVYSARDVRCFRTAGQAADGRGAGLASDLGGIEDCPDGWLCIWAGGNHNGNMAKTQDDKPVDLANIGMRYNVGSWANKQGDSGGLVLTGNSTHEIRPGEQVPNGRQIGSRAEKFFG